MTEADTANPPTFTLREALDQLKGFFSQAAIRSIRDQSSLTALLGRPNTVDHVGKRLGRLLDKDDWTESEILEITALFFLYYIATLYQASKRG